MSDDVFRIVIATAVGIASLAFVIQACVIIAFYRGSKRTQETILTFMGKAEPLIAKIEPVLDQAGPFVERIGVTVDRFGPVIDEFGPAIRKAGPSLERIGPAADKFGQMMDKVGIVLSSADRVIEETRPRIAELTVETVAIAKTGREQVERLGSLLQDAGDRARNRLEQIDQTVGSTVERVEQVGDTVKRAVMKPVREVNGVAAGISAAVSTLVHGSRRSSVDSATQDEEMFI